LCDVIIDIRDSVRAIFDCLAYINYACDVRRLKKKELEEIVLFQIILSPNTWKLASSFAEII